MLDSTENDNHPTGHGLATQDHPDTPVKFDFKRRANDRQTAAGPPTATAVAVRAAAELGPVQPIDWESLTGLTTDEDHREYQTDSDLQSLIVDLANQAATPEELEREARRQTEEMAAVAAALLAASEASTATATTPTPVATPTPASPAAIAAPTAQVPPPPPAPAPPAQAPVPPATAAAAPAAPGRPASLADVLDSEDVDIIDPLPSLPLIVEQTIPSLENPELAVNAALVIGGTESVPVTTSALPPHEPAPAPVSQLVSAPVMVTAPPHATVMASPLPSLQLAKIERRPDAARPTKPVDFHALLGQSGLAPATVTKRKKRHPIRFLFKLVIVLGLLGAGAFYGKKYVLDKRWDAEVKPLAEAVANERELVWKRSVVVTALPMGDYAPKLVASVFGAGTGTGPGTGSGTADLAGQWRSLGLIEGDADLDAVGAYAAAFRPVFYDHTDGTIYELSDIEVEVREFYLNDALAHALLDQHTNWGDKLDTLGPSERLGLRALVDGDARAVALAVVDPSETQLADMNSEMQDLADDQASGLTRSFPVDIIVGAGEPASRVFKSDVYAEMASRTELITDGVASDAAVLEAIRGIGDSPAATGAGDEMYGLSLWYYVLAGRLDDAEAWNAAAVWNGDETVFDSSSTGICMTSTISTLDEAGRQKLQTAFEQWAALAPVESLATVTPVGVDQVEVKSCDPGPAADTMTDVPVTPWGFAADELDAVVDADARATDVRSCTINAIRSYGVHQLSAAGDPAATTAITDIQTSCAGV